MKKQKYPNVSIIVLNYNGINDTRNCLRTLLQTRYPNFKIIVVDNGSRENEAAMLAKEFKNKKIHFVRLPKNLGFTGGNNKIIPQIKDTYVVFLNNDVEVPPNWLDPLVNIMETDKTIAVVQPKILWLQNKEYFDYAGACGGFIDIFGYPFTRGRIFNTIEKDKGQYDKHCDIFWASGAAMMIRRSVLEKIGYFDEVFFNYMEEIDLCFRIQNSGYRITCEPKSHVFHKVASTAMHNPMKKRFWEHRNNLILMLKNYPIRHLIIIFPTRMLLEYTSIIYYLYINEFFLALAVIQSQFSILYYIPFVLLSRFSKKRSGNSSIKKLMYKRSIVFDYFFLRKKQFFQLFDFYKFI